MRPFDILAEQHRELEERLEMLDADDGASGPEAQREQAQALVALVRLHARLEERCLHPLLARVEGRTRAQGQVEDHLAMRELADELEELAPGGAEWWARLLALEDLVVAHARQEEAETFPRLTTTLDPQEQDALRRALAATHEELAPSRTPLLGQGTPAGGAALE